MAASGPSAASLALVKRRHLSTSLRPLVLLSLAFAALLRLAPSFGTCAVAAPGGTLPKTGLKKKKGFGAARPAPKKAVNKLSADIQERVDQRLGKKTHIKRKELLKEVGEQAFVVAGEEVKLMVPKYVLDYQLFAASVENGEGTVSDIVWPAEQALADKMMELRHLWESAGVVELGAGLGLAGIAAARAGASNVLLTDRDKDIMKIARMSAKLNGVEDTVTVMPVDWCDRSTWPNATGSVVVAADVIYDEEVVAPLAELILHLGGEALLMEPVNDERMVLGSVEKFQEVARDKGLSVYVEDFVREGTPMQLVRVTPEVRGYRDGVIDAEVTEVLDPTSRTWVKSSGDGATAKKSAPEPKKLPIVSGCRVELLKGKYGGQTGTVMTDPDSAKAVDVRLDSGVEIGFIKVDICKLI